MPVIYQRFDLDLEETKKLSDLSKRNLPTARNIFIQQLSPEYDYFESENMYRGMPESIILGKNCKLDEARHEEDFYLVANDLGLPFKTGSRYFKSEVTIKPEYVEKIENMKIEDEKGVCIDSEEDLDPLFEEKKE